MRLGDGLVITTDNDVLEGDVEGIGLGNDSIGRGDLVNGGLGLGGSRDGGRSLLTLRNKLLDLRFDDLLICMGILGKAKAHRDESEEERQNDEKGGRPHTNTGECRRPCLGTVQICTFFPVDLL